MDIHDLRDSSLRSSRLYEGKLTRKFLVRVADNLIFQIVPSQCVTASRPST